MPAITRTVVLLVVSNAFMTFAWYAHLRNLNDRKWYIAALVSWGIALFEYLFSNAGESYRLLSIQSRTTQGSSGDYYPRSLRAVRALLHSPAAPVELPLGGTLHGWSSLFRVSIMISMPKG